MEPERFAERVARGATLLDEKMPGWAERIKLNELVLHNPCRCVLGQLFEGDFGEAVMNLFDGDEQAIVEHGFDVPPHRDLPIERGVVTVPSNVMLWEALKQTWRAEILARR